MRAHYDKMEIQAQLSSVCTVQCLCDSISNLYTRYFETCDNVLHIWTQFPQAHYHNVEFTKYTIYVPINAYQIGTVFSVLESGSLPIGNLRSGSNIATRSSFLKGRDVSATGGEDRRGCYC